MYLEFNVEENYARMVSGLAKVARNSHFCLTPTGAEDAKKH